MGSLLFFAFSWWGVILQVLAIVHFIRRRPDTFWLFVILIGGWLGALVYLLIEAVPDAGLLRTSFKAFPRRKRIRQLASEILDNPSAGNYEELADLYLEEKKYARARQCYDKAISARTDSPDPFYRRAVAAVHLGDFAAAVPDLERVVAQDPGYDFHLAAGLLAHAYANTGQPEKAARVVPGSDQDLHRLADLLQLCLLPGLSTPPSRGPRMGPASSRQEAKHARLPPTPGACVVSQSPCLVDPFARLSFCSVGVPPAKSAAQSTLLNFRRGPDRLPRMHQMWCNVSSRPSADRLPRRRRDPLRPL